MENVKVKIKLAKCLWNRFELKLEQFLVARELMI